MTNETKKEETPFMEKYLVFNNILDELSQDISIMMTNLVKDPEILEGKEVFKEGTASLTVEASLYCYHLLQSKKELRQSILGAYNSLQELEKLNVSE